MNTALESSGPRGRTHLLMFLLAASLFTVSGACGLLYQVVWTRKLVLLFGTTPYAVSTVLSIFFLGLALGSLWGGRLADRTPRPLLWYGAMELFIGAFALLFIVTVDAGESAIVPLLQWAGPSRVLGLATRGALALLLLLGPVMLMGATLPLLARFVTEGRDRHGFRIGALYSLNTLGAVAGCFVTGFVLIEALGYTRTTLIGAALNAAAGIIALAAGWRAQRSDVLLGSSSLTSSRLEMPPTQSLAITYAVMGAFAVSGFCSLALEVLWTRMLTIVFIGTTYAFTTMLTSVLCGIALGGAVAALFADRVRHPVAAYGIVMALTGIATCATLLVFPSLPGILRDLQATVGYDWDQSMVRKFVVCFLVLLPPMFFFGMSFPFAVRAAVRGREALGQSVGRLYGANTFGGVLGALAGGYLILPLLGSHWGIVALAALASLAGLALLYACPTMSAPIRHAFAALGLAGFGFVVFALPENVAASLNGTYLWEDHESIHFTEGVEGTVLVSQPADDTSGSNRVLWINAVQATASIDKGVKMNRFQGILPMLFDRDPRLALFMCFGSGITAGTLALSPFERIDAVEISRDVIEAAPFFAKDNFDVRNNPRVNFIHDDGRNFLLTALDRYDLISFEPMPLALAGVSAFYTREYYELCRAKLAPGGLVSQWVPLHSLNDAVVRSMIGTFLDVFPEATAWFINSDIFLIGSDQPLRIDYARAEARIAANNPLRDGLGDVYLGDTVELIASFLMGKDNLARYAGDAPRMDDDRPWAEFLAPKLARENDVIGSLVAIEPYLESPVAYLAAGIPAETTQAIERRHLAHKNDFRALQGYYNAVIGSTPEVGFRDSLAIDPDDLNAQYYLSEILLRQGVRLTHWAEYENAIAALFEALAVAPDRADIILAMGDAYHEWEKPQDAAKCYADYIAMGGDAPRAQTRAIP